MPISSPLLLAMTEQPALGFKAGRRGKDLGGLWPLTRFGDLLGDLEKQATKHGFCPPG